jgi:hypothetical protein
MGEVIDLGPLFQLAREIGEVEREINSVIAMSDADLVVLDKTIEDLKKVAPWAVGSVKALRERLRLAESVVKYARSVRAPLEEDGSVPWWAFELSNAIKEFDRAAVKGEE